MKNLELNQLLFEGGDMNPFTEDELAMVMGGGDEGTEFVFYSPPTVTDMVDDFDEFLD